MKDLPEFLKSVKIFYCSLPIACVTRMLLKRASKFDKFKRNSTRFYHELLEGYLLHATFLLPSWVFSITCFINNCVIFLFFYLLTSEGIFSGRRNENVIAVLVLYYHCHSAGTNTFFWCFVGSVKHAWHLALYAFLILFYKIMYVVTMAKGICLKCRWAIFQYLLY